jgi:hypothetical protein
MDEGWSHTREFPARPGSVSSARTFVRVQLATHDVVHLDDALQLVVSELATNALVHTPSRFTVTLEGGLTTIRLVVLDESAARLVPSIALGTDVGGRGLMIVDALSRGWGVLYDDNGGKSVWAEFTR